MRQHGEELILLLVGALGFGSGFLFALGRFAGAAFTGHQLEFPLGFRARMETGDAGDGDKQRGADDAGEDAEPHRVLIRLV